MFLGLKNGLERVISKFIELPTIPRKLVKTGFILFLLIFASGTFIVMANRYYSSYDPYYDYIGIQLVKNSFNILAEFVIGAIVMDFIFARNK